MKRLNNNLENVTITPLSYEELGKKLKNESSFLEYKIVESTSSLTTTTKKLDGTTRDSFSFKVSDDDSEKINSERQIFFGNDGIDKILFLKKEDEIYSYSHADSLLSALSVELDRVDHIMEDLASKNDHYTPAIMNSNSKNDFFKFNNGDSNSTLGGN